VVATDDHCPGRQEQQGLEEGVGHQMEDRSIERAYPQRHEHVANLAHGGVGQHALDIGLGQSRKGRQQQRHRPDHADQQEHIRGQQEQAIDLAGRDVLDAVKMSVNPRVIETPRVSAIAKDGIQLYSVAKVTVRANIERLIGGAGEETVLARVGEGIVSSIGSSEAHKEVLENPDIISKNVLAKGLDAGTAFEILSIDIADVDVGKNIGATLQMDQADADKNIAQAVAEKRRAMAVATEQEMKARTQEMRAKVVEAQAEVPKAMAEAFRQGNLGILDYYRMENIQADTAMRKNLAGSDEPEQK